MVPNLIAKNTCVGFVVQLRIQHETYAPDQKQSSRLVVLLHDLEVRDRLAQSRINKFLYQYSTESMPRQSQSNTVSSMERTWQRQRRGESRGGVWWEKENEDDYMVGGTPMISVGGCE